MCVKDGCYWTVMIVLSSSVSSLHMTRPTPYPEDPVSQPYQPPLSLELSAIPSTSGPLHMLCPLPRTSSLLPSWHGCLLSLFPLKKRILGGCVPCTGGKTEAQRMPRTCSGPHRTPGTHPEGEAVLGVVAVMEEASSITDQH